MLGIVSYSITVHSLVGRLMFEQSGDVPDGTHAISGHEDDRGRSVGVVRQHPEGHQVIAASGHHSREQ